MTIFLYTLIYAAALAFLIACIVRAVSYKRKPVHLRWELYPVPHEEAHRARHGGSYFEMTDWWSKPPRFNMTGELKAMAQEILFLKGLREFNKRMWLWSFPFHFGLYLLIATVALVTSSALAAIVSPGILRGAAGPALHLIYTFTGIAGSALTVLGAFGLLVRRLTDKELKTYTTPGDIFNLAFFIVAIGVSAAGYIGKGAGSPGTLDLARGILTLDTSLSVPGLLAIGLALGALLVAYIPRTHMSHFIAKYFTYHSVRWDDQPAVKSRKLQKKLAEYLTYRPTWAAPHIGADGARTWADIATTNPAQGIKR